MRNILNICFDILAFVIGVTTLTLLFVNPESEFLNHLIIAGALLCGAYIVRVICLLVRMPKFDWHLLHGHFLYKVVCFVLLMPCLMTSLIKCDKGSLQCAKEFISEDDLYPGSTKEQCKHYLEDRQVAPPLLWSVYLHFMDPGNQHMTSTKNSRGWAGVIAILGVFLLNGLLVSSIIGWVDRRKEKWQKGEVRYKWFLRFRSHYTIIGGNDMVMGVVKQIFDKIDSENTLIKPYILIQTSRDIESFRRNLFSTLTEEQQQRVVIYYGNRNSEEDIKELGLCNTKEVYILGEDVRTDDIESYHDTMNMECLKLISENIQNIEQYNKENPLVCRVMFEYQTSFNILQVTDIDGQKIDFRPFNYYETWAQNVLICQELDKVENCKYLPLEGFDGIQADQDKFVHFIVVGMSRMGLAMAIEAAHLAHYPNFCTNKKRTRITFIDASMEQEKHFFMSRFKEMFSLANYRDITNATENMYSDLEAYPWQNPLEDVSCKSPYCNSDHLGKDFIDIEWEFINGSVENPNIQQYLADAAENADAKLTIVICLPENSRAIAAATYLPDSVYKSDSTLQILVYQRLNDNLLIQINQNKRYCRKLKAFGMNSLCYNFDLVELSEFIAQRVNSAYNQYSWERILSRYNGDGLIDDDYSSLSNDLYCDTKISTDIKEYIKNECNKWMDCNSDESSYQTVSSRLKDFQDGLEQYISEHNTPKHNDHSEGNAGKSKSAKMWSNQYNVYSMWTKFRCFGVNPTKLQDFEDIKISELGKMEHNRWIVEQLLLRSRPLMKDEQAKAQIVNLYSSSKQKDIYKKEYAHLDICSNDKLNEIDYNMAKLDQALVKVLPGAYREYSEEKTKKCPTNKS